MDGEFDRRADTRVGAAASGSGLDMPLKTRDSILTGEDLSGNPILISLKDEATHKLEIGASVSANPTRSFITLGNTRG